MKEPNKTDLLTTLADYERQIQKLVPQLTGPIGSPEWQETFDQIVQLRNAQLELTTRLAALDE